VVKHFAGLVQYTADRWLEKNRGRMQPEVLALLSSSTSPIVQGMFGSLSVDDDGFVVDPSTAGSAILPGKQRRKMTVSSAFRGSLRALSATLLETEQHFIRCIKPNPEQKPDSFNLEYIMRQLRENGVPAVCEIMQSGYPVKFLHKNFVRRYKCIAFDQPKLIADTVPFVEQCTNIIKLVLSREPDNMGDWFEEKLVQVGETKIFVKGGPDSQRVMLGLERPRAEARIRAGTAVQRYARRRVLRRLMRFKRELGVMCKSLQQLLNFSCEDCDRRDATVEAAVKEGRTILAELMKQLSKSGWMLFNLPENNKPSISRFAKCGVELLRMVIELREELQATESDLSSLEAGLANDRQVLSALQSVVSDSREDDKSREAFVALKLALTTAQDNSAAVTSDLEEAIKAAEEMLESRFSGMITEWEGEVSREKDAKEALRKKQQAAMEQLAVADPDFIVLNLTVRNGLDPNSTTPKPLAGGSITGLGIKFDQLGRVAVIVRGGPASIAGNLRVRDKVLAIEGDPLMGRRVEEVMDEQNRIMYALLVARKKTPAQLKADEQGLPIGKHQGWLMLCRQHKRSKAGAEERPHKAWLVLTEDDQLIVHEKKENMATPRTRTADTSECVRVSRSEPTTFVGIKVDLRGAAFKVASKAPIRMAGASVKENPVIKELFEKGLFPFRIVWPDGEVDVEYICAANSVVERTTWEKTVTETLKRMEKTAPTTGYLMKQKGRRGSNPIANMLGGWDKRWFVLTPWTEGSEARFVYFANKDSKDAKGVIALNEKAQVLRAVKYDHAEGSAFSITSQGPNDPMAITTTLSAPSEGEMERWMSAVSAALKRPTGKALTKEEKSLLSKTVPELRALLTYLSVQGYEQNEDKGSLVRAVLDHRAKAKHAKKSQVREQKAKLDKDRDRLHGRSVEELKQLLFFLDVEVDQALEDKDKLVDMVLQQKATRKEEEEADGVSTPASP